jgi:hypothetical protein
VGPRRSNHYLLVAKGATATPSISIMASSREVEGIAPLHLTIYPLNDRLARAAAQVASKIGKTYFTAVSDDCLSCKDFSIAFDQSALGLKLKKLGEAKVVGENPDSAALVEAIVKSAPSFVLLPNYSKVSALLMGAIHERLPNVRFVGGDGWGDQKFGFVEKNPAVKSAPGLTVRGFPPADIGLKQFSLGRKAITAAKSGGFLPSSGPGLAILRIFEGLESALCSTKVKTSEAFKINYLKNGKRWFSSPWGINVYEVKGGAISYVKTMRDQSL